MIGRWSWTLEVDDIYHLRAGNCRKRCSGICSLAPSTIPIEVVFLEPLASLRHLQKCSHSMPHDVCRGLAVILCLLVFAELPELCKIWCLVVDACLIDEQLGDTSLPLEALRDGLFIILGLTGLFTTHYQICHS